MTFLRSFAFAAAFWIWAVVMHLLGVVLVLGPRPVFMAMSRVWLGGVLWLARHTAGITYEVRGEANMPDRPCIIAAKHQSAWDIFALSVLLDQPTFVLKKELMHVPFFGWFLRRYGAVPVDRKAGASALRGMLRRAKAEMARGRSVVIFPEGTRVPPGETRPYHPGVAGLYRELDVPLVPVTLNSGWFWGRRKFRKNPGTIVVEFRPAIPPGLSRREVMARLSEALERDSRE